MYPPEIQSSIDVIDAYLASPAIVPSIEDIVDPYTEVIGGYQDMGEAYVDEIQAKYPDASKEDVKAEIDKQKEEFKKSILTTMKPELQKKLDELKARVAEIKDAAVNTGTEIVKGSADAAMPSMITMGAPNPIHVALKYIALAFAVLKTVNSCLRAINSALHLIEELGLSKSGMAEKLIALINPLLALKAKMEQLKAENEEMSSKCLEDLNPPGAVDPDYTATLPSGQVVTAQEIVEQADMNALLVPVEDEEGLQVLQVMLSSGNAETAGWAKAIQDYSAYLLSKG